MLSRAIRGSLSHPRLIAAAALVFAIYAALLLKTEPVDLFPVLSPAQASVETEAPGMVAEQVEELVTRPVENALIGAHGVAAVRSRSIQGLSVITLDFQAGADPGQARQAISEGLVQTAGLLPKGVGSPHLSPLTAGTDQLLSLGFTSDHLSPMALRDLVQWTVRPRLLSSSGVANVQVFGGETRRVEVRARAGDLSDSDLGYGDVFDAVQRATGVAGAGFIDTPTQRVQIEPHGQALSDIDVAAGQIQIVGSAPVRISDVADVVDAPAPAFGDALIQGRPGVLVSVSARFGANTLQATQGVQAVLAALGPVFKQQGVTVSADLDRPADFIGRGIKAIYWELGLSAAMLAALSLLFLRDWRAAAVSIISIPLSFLTAVVVLRYLGWSLNTMTLGGLAVALGLIVDDAVIDVENVLSRLRAAEVRHASRAHAILSASLGVRAPVIYVTLMVAVALTPILFLNGVQGALIRPLAVSLIVAALASLAVQILITPAMALLFLKHIGPDAEPPIVRRLKGGYEAVLVRIDQWPSLALVAAAASAVIAAFILIFVKVQILPTFHDDQLTADVIAPSATSMSAMRAYGQGLSRDLLAIHNVVSVAQTIGRSESSENAWEPEHTSFDIALTPGLSSSRQDDVENRVKSAIAAYPGLNTQVRPALGIADALGRSGPKIEARIFGNDLEAVSDASRRLAARLKAVKGVRNVTTTASDTAPVIRVDLNFQRLAIYGLSAADVLNTVQTAFAGRNAAQIYENGRAVDVAVTAQASLRQDPEGVGDLLLRSSSGVSVPLKGVANVYLTEGRTRIDHDGGLRSESVLADPPNDRAEAIAKLESDLASKLDAPKGVYFEFVNPKPPFDPSRSLLVNSLLGAAGVIVLLLLAFGSVRASAVVLASALFAFLGGVLALVLSGGVLSLGSLVGFFVLLGLSARNAALLLSQVEDLLSWSKAPWSMQTVRRAAHDRFSPMAISAVMIFVGLAPFALNADTPGHEIIGPMVIVLLGGLTLSTLMGMAFLPALVFQIWRPEPDRPSSDGMPDDVAAVPPPAA